MERIWGRVKGTREGKLVKAAIDIGRGVYRDMMSIDGLLRYQFGDGYAFEKELD